MQVKKYEEVHGNNKSTYWVIFELIWRDFFRWRLHHASSVAARSCMNSCRVSMRFLCVSKHFQENLLHVQVLCNVVPGWSC